jgi:hypothetical protein
VPGATKVLIEKEDLSLDVIKQHKVVVDGPVHKDAVLKSYILGNADKLGQMIVFVRTRWSADNLFRVCSHVATSVPASTVMPPADCTFHTACKICCGGKWRWHRVLALASSRWQDPGP